MIDIAPNRIRKTLEFKGDALTIFFTAGYPKLQDTMVILESLEAAGADMVEIGIPFSDPVADGPTIQQSNLVALNNGMTVKLLFEQLIDMRQSVGIPVLIMSSLNPILQFGLEEFCKKCSEVGIDGLILPDLPVVEYEELYKPIFEENGLVNILLITPSTSEARINKIDDLTNGFIYMVSSSSTTGKSQGVSADQLKYFERIQALKLTSPVLTGFGIHDRDSFNEVCKYGRGGIIGSAFIKALKGEDVVRETTDFVKNIK